MAIIVTDSGFSTDDWGHGYVALDDVSTVTAATFAVDVPSDADPDILSLYLDRICLIRIDFPTFADGRGFTLARRVRQLKYQGRLRAKGHIVADQYTMVRRCGFDEVEIETTLADRQPEAQWAYRANWQANDYQTKLRLDQ